MAVVSIERVRQLLDQRVGQAQENIESKVEERVGQAQEKISAMQRQQSQMSSKQVLHNNYRRNCVCALCFDEVWVTFKPASLTSTFRKNVSS